MGVRGSLGGSQLDYQLRTATLIEVFVPVKRLLSFRNI
jgi:hypothetical protein